MMARPTKHDVSPRTREAIEFIEDIVNTPLLWPFPRKTRRHGGPRARQTFK